MKSASTERMGSASVFEEIDRLKSENRRLQTLYATSLALTAQTQKDDEKTNRLLPSAAPLFQTICSNLNSSATNKARLRARQNQSKAKSDFQRRFAPRNNRHAGFSNADTTWQNPCRRRNRISENVFDQNPSKNIVHYRSGKATWHQSHALLQTAHATWNSLLRLSGRSMVGRLRLHEAEQSGISNDKFYRQTKKAGKRCILTTPCCKQATKISSMR